VKRQLDTSDHEELKDHIKMVGGSFGKQIAKHYRRQCNIIHPR